MNKRTEGRKTRQCWLMKSEPGSYSIDDLARDGMTMWDGVRNYQARNFMRDAMRIGDQVLFYHSSVNPAGIAGLAEVASEPYPDPTAFDAHDPHFDPKSKKEMPTWYLVDIRFKKRFKDIISLEELKGEAALTDMLVVKRGQRLSVQPVDKKHFDHIMNMAQL